MSFDRMIKPPAQLAAIFVQRAVEIARDAQQKRGRFSVALPGGSVARAFLPALADAPLDWSRVECFWGDERSVPLDDPDSNYALAADLLLSEVAIPSANVHRMPADAGDPDEAAKMYEREMRTTLGSPAVLDLILLGVGPDGHVCSLFPGHAALGERERLVIPISDSPKPPPRRLTLTLLALAGSEIHVAAFGAEKTPVLREALEDAQSQLPVAIAARGARRALFLMDPDAAP